MATIGRASYDLGLATHAQPKYPPPVRSKTITADLGNPRSLEGSRYHLCQGEPHMGERSSVTTPDDQAHSLSAEEEWQLRIALASARGRYPYDRASQLSGVPRRTVHHWAHQGWVVPDFHQGHPMSWSYRDLVFLRFFAWVRSKGMSPNDAHERVTYLKRVLQESIGAVREIRSDGVSVFIGDETVDRLTNWQGIADVVRFVGVFDLMAPLDEGAGKANKLWGPHLIHPSRYTYISPWIMGGQPCVRGTRVPSSALFALNYERGLEPEAIAQLYSNMEQVAVVDSITLEKRIRRLASNPNVEQSIPS